MSTQSKTKILGTATAYGYAVKHGYTGTEEEFGEEQAKFAENAKKLRETKEEVLLMKESVEEVKTQVEQLASNAGQSATNAHDSETKAKDSETKAKDYETKAKDSETKAKESETIVSENAKKAGVSEANARQSEQNALQSANRAGTSEQNAAQSEQNAGQSALNAAQSAQEARDSNTTAFQYAEKAAGHETRAREIVEESNGTVEAAQEQANEARRQAEIAAQKAGELEGAVEAVNTVKDGIVKVNEDPVPETRLHITTSEDEVEIPDMEDFNKLSESVMEISETEIKNGLTVFPNVRYFGEFITNGSGEIIPAVPEGRDSYVVALNGNEKISINVSNVGYRGWFVEYPKVGGACIEQTQVFVPAGVTELQAPANAKYLFFSTAKDGTITVSTSSKGLHERVTEDINVAKNALDEKITDVKESVSDIARTYNAELSWIDGKYVGPEGNIGNSDTVSRTDKINVSNASKVSVNFAYGPNQYISSIAFFNDEPRRETCVLAIQTVSVGEYIEVPDDALYMVVSRATNYKNDVIVKIVESEIDNINKKLSNITYAKETGVFFGDSIMQGVGVLPQDGSVPINDVSHVCERILGNKIYNCGIGGTTLTRGTDANFCSIVDAILGDTDWTTIDAYIEDAISQYSNFAGLRTTIAEIKTLDFNSVDFILIAYGTNDWTAGRPIGEDTSTNDGEFAGALKYVLNKLLTAYPHLKVYIVAPAYRWDKTSGIDSDEQTFGGKNLAEYTAGIVHACNLLHLPCKNLYTDGMVNRYNRTTFLSDGVHRNIRGYQLLGEQYAKFITSN